MSTQLVLLGTAGGPTPRGKRHAPSQVILVDGEAYVIDCGNGVAGQLFQAGVPFSALRAVFITHHHSDHNADLGNLFLLGWSGLSQRTTIIGPPPLMSIMRCFFEMNQYDISIRTSDEGRPSLEEFIHLEETTREGVVYRDERVQVTAALVDHPPLAHAFAYRIDTADRSIVISGDTKPCENLIALANHADILVHEAMFEPAIGNLVLGNNGLSIRDHLMKSHTSVTDVGAIAERAGVPRLVLSHLTPSSDVVSHDIWESNARHGYHGDVIVGEDLLVI